MQKKINVKELNSFVTLIESDIDAVIDQTSIYVVLEVPMQTYFGIKGILKQSKLFSIDKLM